MGMMATRGDMKFVIVVCLLAIISQSHGNMMLKGTLICQTDETAFEPSTMHLLSQYCKQIIGKPLNLNTATWSLMDASNKDLPDEQFNATFSDSVVLLDSKELGVVERILRLNLMNLGSDNLDISFSSSALRDALDIQMEESHINGVALYLADNLQVDGVIDFLTYIVTLKQFGLIDRVYLHLSTQNETNSMIFENFDTNIDGYFKYKTLSEIKNDQSSEEPLLPSPDFHYDGMIPINKTIPQITPQLYLEDLQTGRYTYLSKSELCNIIKDKRLNWRVSESRQKAIVGQNDTNMVIFDSFSSVALLISFLRSHNFGGCVMKLTRDDFFDTCPLSHSSSLPLAYSMLLGAHPEMVYEDEEEGFDHLLKGNKTMATKQPGFCAGCQYNLTQIRNLVAHYGETDLWKKKPTLKNRDRTASLELPFVRDTGFLLPQENSYGNNGSNSNQSTPFEEDRIMAEHVNPLYESGKENLKKGSLENVFKKAPSSSEEWPLPPPEIENPSDLEDLLPELEKRIAEQLEKPSGNKPNSGTEIPPAPPLDLEKKPVLKYVTPEFEKNIFGYLNNLPKPKLHGNGDKTPPPPPPLHVDKIPYPAPKFDESIVGNLKPTDSKKSTNPVLGANFVSELTLAIKHRRKVETDDQGRIKPFVPANQSGDQPNKETNNPLVVEEKPSYAIRAGNLYKWSELKKSPQMKPKYFFRGGEVLRSATNKSCKERQVNPELLVRDQMVYLPLRNKSPSDDFKEADDPKRVLQGLDPKFVIHGTKLYKIVYKAKTPGKAKDSAVINKSTENPKTNEVTEKEPEKPKDNKIIEKEPEKPEDNKVIEKEPGKPEDNKVIEKEPEKPKDNKIIEKEPEKPEDNKVTEKEPEKPEDNKVIEKEPENPEDNKVTEKEPEKPEDNKVIEKEPEKPEDNKVTEKEPEKPEDNKVIEKEPEKPEDNKVIEKEPEKPEDNKVIEKEPEKPKTYEIAEEEPEKSKDDEDIENPKTYEVIEESEEPEYNKMIEKEPKRPKYDEIIEHVRLQVKYFVNQRVVYKLPKVGHLATPDEVDSEEDTFDDEVHLLKNGIIYKLPSMESKKMIAFLKSRPDVSTLKPQYLLNRDKILAIPKAIKNQVFYKGADLEQFEDTTDPGLYVILKGVIHTIA